MWNEYDVTAYSGLTAETITIKGHGGKDIQAYYSYPLRAENVPSIVLIPSGKGWDEFSLETARRFSQHGYSVLCPNIFNDGGAGTALEQRARARESGAVSDKDVMEDTAAALAFLKNQTNASGKVGVIGMCSGGRHTFLAACTLEGIDAAVDCWGNDVIQPPEKLSENQPVAPIDLTENLSCPLLGIFGAEDFNPTMPMIEETERRLKECGKDYEFHIYEGAGHAFWCYDQDKYRPEQCIDAWNKTLAFFDRHLK